MKYIEGKRTEILSQLPHTVEKLEFSLKKNGLELFENISIEFQAPKLDFRNLKLKID